MNYFISFINQSVNNLIVRSLTHFLPCRIEDTQGLGLPHVSHNFFDCIGPTLYPVIQSDETRMHIYYMYSIYFNSLFYLFQWGKTVLTKVRDQ